MNDDKKESYIRVRKKHLVYSVVIIASLMTILISSTLYSMPISLQVQVEHPNNRTLHQVIAQSAPELPNSNNKSLTASQNPSSIIKETTPKTNLTATEVNPNSQLTLNSTIQPIKR
jgi:hypothetical protein